MWTTEVIADKDQGKLSNNIGFDEGDDHIEEIHDFTSLKKHRLQEEIKMKI